MSEGVDAEGSLLDEEDPQDATIDKAAHPVTPKEPADKHWEDEAHEEDNLEVVLVLPDNNRILVQIGDVGTTNSLWVLLHEHPPEVRVQQSLADGIWVLLGVGVAMVSTVVSRPPSDGAFNGTTTDSGE